ncbi:MAG: metal ABC transporter permease [Cyanobacteria bacterium P01_H01_bin.121]
MSLAAELVRIIQLLQQPFMQRALISSALMGCTSGLLGSITLLRQLSFFSIALGNSALLGMSLGIVLGLEPTSVLLPFAVVFAVVVASLLQRTNLRNDTALNITYATALALAVIILGFVQSDTSTIKNLLFGDILALRQGDLYVSAGLLVVCLLYLLFSSLRQMRFSSSEPLAIAREGSAIKVRLTFVLLLAVVVAVSIKTVGALLVSAFLVLPAAAARLLNRSFLLYVGLAAILGTTSAVAGTFVAAFFNLYSGPSIVIVQFILLIMAIALNRMTAASR